MWARGECTDAQWRIHFHVPLYFTGGSGLGTTANELTPEILNRAAEAGAQHFEIETYTFDVLPERLRKTGVIESVAREYDWVLKKWSFRPTPFGTDCPI
jgi:hypothetical protein